MAVIVPMSDADRTRVGAAVAAAEASSSGEIVTVLADSSDGYSDIALAWSIAAALIVLILLALLPSTWLGLYDGVAGEWGRDWTPRALFTFAAVCAAVTFAIVWLLQFIPAIRYALVPRAVRHARVRERAVGLFKVGAERRTTGRTGILIYLSLREHRAEIVADQAIACRVPAEVWGEAMAAMLPHLREGRTADGLCEAVTRVGVVLAEELPQGGSERNELPDRLIEL